MKTAYMDRDTTAAIKGIALICMFVHHFFTFPGFYVEGISYPNLLDFADDFCVPLKICVPAFAFLTGYFYHFAKQKTLRYSLRKITDLYLSYWFVYLPLMVFAVLTGCWEFYPTGMVKEMLALDTPIMIFCWYVYFYAAVMLLLPLLTRADDHAPAEDILLLLILPVTVTSVLAYSGLEGFAWQLVIDLRDWFPCVASGYLCAKYRVFETFFDHGLSRFRHTLTQTAILIFMALSAFFGRYYCQFLHLGTLNIRGGMYELTYTMDILYAPLFVYSCARLLQGLRKTILFPLLGKIGKQSLLMWFLHGIFFNVSKEITQPMVYAPRNPILVTLFALLLCYLGAVCIDKLLKPTLKLKNKVF